ncbi:MAG TPA: Cys-tRNA(Pro) deacylase [Acidimicrobiales bacterium]|nr:Cys-tRNA(Pro) deacylase [Acidimicrobiales bacterium]
MSSNGPTPAVRAAASAGVDYTLHRYDHDPEAESYAEEAADELDVPPERVFKTLVTTVDERMVVAVVPATGQLDLKALAAALGAKKAVMAHPYEAERVTGYVLGGISPIGHRRRLPVVVDRTARQYTTVFVSAGRRGLELELAPGDLIRLTAAAEADLRA